MKQIDIVEPGGPEMLHLADGPIPMPRPGEVRIRVHAAGINRPDILQRRGLYPAPPGASPVPGLEVAGVIDAVAHDVDQPRVGDRVCALLAGGGYAEYATTPASQCLPVPDGLDFIQAAALPETTFTVWHNIFERGALQPGESLLVHGGSSGIGTTAIQIAAARGHRVFTTAGSAVKCAACLELGAQVAIPYHQQDFVEVVLDVTDGRGVDVVLDMVGGDYTARNMQCAAPDGRIVQIAMLQNARVQVDLRPLLVKRLTLTGSTLRARDATFKARLARSVEQQVWPLIEAGRVQPHIDMVFPLGRVSEAHQRMESGDHIGKIVLQVIEN
jgi:NADPH2:quinone reductase